MLLDDDEKLFTCLLNGPQGFKRGLPKKNVLQKNHAIAQFLREVIVFHRSKDTLEENPSLNSCYKNGWLQAELSANEDPVYIFPTNLHRRYSLSNVHHYQRNKLIFSKICRVCAAHYKPTFSARSVSFYQGSVLCCGARILPCCNKVWTRIWCWRFGAAS
jgi:hypothetical protein